MNNEQQQKAQALGLLVEGSKTSKIWLVLIVLAIIAAVVGWWLSSNTEAKMVYKTSPVKRMDISLTVSATGSITPKDQVELSSELSGIVEEVFVDYNDKVVAGQKLAQLDTSKLSATVTQRKSILRSANAQVKTAQANLEEAKLNYQYNQKVWAESNGKFPSQQTMDNARITLTKAEASVEQAKASVENAKAELEYAESDLEKSTIISPIDGVVLSRAVEAGQTVASSFSAPTLFLLARDLKAMELVVDIDEADIGVIQVGQPAKFTVDAYRDRTFKAEITQIRLANISENKSSSSVVAYSTVLRVDNDQLLLLPGMTAVTDIIVASAAKALVINNAALRYQPRTNQDAAQNAGRSGGMMGTLMPPRGFGNRPAKKAGEESAISDQMRHRPATIWVLRNQQPVQVDVVLGLSDGINTEVVSGDLEEGDEVISDAVQVRS